jgi:hypothetical protein
MKKRRRQKWRGILFGNPWRDRPPEDRGKVDTVIYPQNVMSRATEFGIALVWSVDFFRIFCRFLTGDVSGDALLDRITSGVGIVRFDDL